MKFSVDGVYRPSRLVRLESSPGCLESLDTSRPFPYTAKLTPIVQIVQERLSFKTRHSETKERYKWSEGVRLTVEGCSGGSGPVR